MVVVRDISADVFVRLGFMSKTQALETYKGIGSKRGETQDEYLRRTWHLVKHVVHQNQIDDLIAEESKKRVKIERSESRSVKAKTEPTVNDYKAMLKATNEAHEASFNRCMSNYTDLMDRYEELAKVTMQLKQENDMLMKAYSKLVVSVL